MRMAMTERRKLRRALQRLRTEHVELIKKVAKSRVHFEKRSRELRALAAEIPELLRWLEEPETHRLWAAALSEIVLQPTQLVMCCPVNGNSGGREL